MDPTIAQYGALVTNLTLAGFMAIMLLSWNKESTKQREQEVKERKTEAEQRTADARVENEKCRVCMDQHRQDYQDLLDKVLMQMQDNTRFMETVANGLNTQRRMDQIEKMLGERRGDSNHRRPYAADREGQADKQRP